MAILSKQAATVRGFTLIETLVAIAIIGILAALIIPAVSSVRESARNLECTNRLRQLGVALQSHQSVTSVFPAPMPARLLFRDKMWALPNSLSGYYELLPYIELNSLYNAINLGGFQSNASTSYGPSHATNMTAFTTRVGNFICPSDTKERYIAHGTNGYRFNLGSSNPTVNVEPPRAGAFSPMKPLSPSEYRDGLSVTVGMSERLLGGHAEGRFDRKRDFWCAGVYPTFNLRTDDDTLDVCRASTSIVDQFRSDMGGSWMFAGSIYIWYNHVAPPNERWSDCATSVKSSSGPLYCETCSIAARSHHGSGVNCLLMDASVRFVSESINLLVWRAVGTRSGSESVDSSW